MRHDLRISKQELTEIAAEYGLPKVSGVREIDDLGFGQYLLETSKGRFAVRLGPLVSEIEAKRELDFLLFLQKFGFPCHVPLADRRGRYCRDWAGHGLSLSRFVDVRAVNLAAMTGAKLEAVGRVIGEFHLITKSYKKGVESRFSFERISEVYLEARELLPVYSKRILRTLDEEREYLLDYLEGKLPKGLILGDLWPSNLRFKGDKLVLILGGETVSRGKFIFDLANAVNLLCFVDQSYHLKRFESLVAGYESVRTLSLAEWDAFPNELRYSAFRLAAVRLRDALRATGEERVRRNREFQDYFELLRVLRRERDGGMDRLLMAMATGYDYRRYQKVKPVEKRSVPETA